MEVIDSPTRRTHRSKRGRDPDRFGILEAEDSTVQELVVEGTEGQPVVEAVWAAEVEPPHVGGLDPHGRSSKRTVESAEGA